MTATFSGFFTYIFIIYTGNENAPNRKKYKTVFLFEYVHCMPKFSSAKMLMYIISLLTGPYSVAWGSAGACVHVCVCVCVCV